MKDYEVGSIYFFDYNELLTNDPKNRSIDNVKKGQVRYSKYGPQLTIQVESMKLKGFFGRVLRINEERVGHYSEWQEYKEYSSMDNPTDEDFENLINTLNS